MLVEGASRAKVVAVHSGDYFSADIELLAEGVEEESRELDGLKRIENYFMLQTDPDGNPLGAMPQILLVPTSLDSDARVLMNSQFVVTGADLTRGQTNVFGGKYSVVSSPYMENSNYTGYSALAWYLLASPADLPTVEVAFLDGRDAPEVLHCRRR